MEKDKGRGEAMTPDEFDSVIASVLFVCLCLKLMGWALSWVLNYAKRKGGLDVKTQ